MEMIPKQTRSRMQANKESENLWSGSATGVVGISHQSKEGPEKWLDRCVHLRQDDTGGCSTWLISNNFVSLFGEWILIKRKMCCNPLRCCGWNWVFCCVAFFLLYFCHASKADSLWFDSWLTRKKCATLCTQSVNCRIIIIIYRYQWDEWKSLLPLSNCSQNITLSVIVRNSLEDLWFHRHSGLIKNKKTSSWSSRLFRGDSTEVDWLQDVSRRTN